MNWILNQKNIIQFVLISLIWGKALQFVWTNYNELSFHFACVWFYETRFCVDIVHKHFRVCTQLRTGTSNQIGRLTIDVSKANINESMTHWVIHITYWFLSAGCFLLSVIKSILSIVWIGNFTRNRLHLVVTIFATERMMNMNMQWITKSPFLFFFGNCFYLYVFK